MYIYIYVYIHIHIHVYILGELPSGSKGPIIGHITFAVGLVWTVVGRAFIPLITRLRTLNVSVGL